MDARLEAVEVAIACKMVGEANSLQEWELMLLAALAKPKAQSP